MSHCQRNFNLSLDDLGTCFLSFRFHLLFEGHCHRTTLLSLGLGNVLVSIGLVHLQHGTDVLAYINVRDINRENLKSCSCIKTLLKHRLTYPVRILKHFLMAVRRTDR